MKVTVTTAALTPYSMYAILRVAAFIFVCSLLTTEANLRSRQRPAVDADAESKSKSTSKTGSSSSASLPFDAIPDLKSVSPLKRSLSSYGEYTTSSTIACSVVQGTQTLTGFLDVELRGNALSNQQLNTIGQIIKSTYNAMISCGIQQSRTINSLQFADQWSVDSDEYIVRYRVTSGSCQGCPNQPTLLWRTSNSCGCAGPTESSIRNVLRVDIEAQFPALDVRDVMDAQDPSVVSNPPPPPPTLLPTLPPTPQPTLQPTPSPTVIASTKPTPLPTPLQTPQPIQPIIPPTTLFAPSDFTTSTTVSPTDTTTSDNGSCPDWIEFTTSDVVVEFVGCPSALTDVHLDTLASQFVQVYNVQNSGTDMTFPCDPYFREILLAKSTLLNTTFKIDDHSARRLSSPYGTYYEDSGSSSSDCKQNFQVRFDITARCMGCDVNSITLFDLDEAANFNADFYTKSDRRLNHLQVDQDSRHLLGCQCPIDAQLRAICEDEMEDVYDDVVRRLSELPVPLRVKEIIEVEKVQCHPTISNFETTLRLAYATDSIDGISTPEVLGALATNFLGSYNDLSQSFCDPFFRYPWVVDILNQTVVPVSSAQRRNLQAVRLDLSFLSGIAAFKKPKRNVTVKFNFNFSWLSTLVITIKGNCRGCASKTPLFQNQAARRRLSGVPFTSAKYRRVQSGTQCFCASSNYQDGAPTQREFSERYDQDILSDPRLVPNVSLAFFEEDTAADAMVASPSECNFNSDCPVVPTGSLCVSNLCLSEGSPRITLTWTGDDDLDLAVYTPDGTKVWYGANFDPTTRGSYDTRYVQDMWGNHVENVYFPNGPTGMYRIEVTSYEQRGEADTWTVEVFVGGTKVFHQEDSGGMVSSNQQIHYYNA